MDGAMQICAGTYEGRRLGKCSFTAVAVAELSETSLNEKRYAYKLVIWYINTLSFNRETRRNENEQQNCFSINYVVIYQTKERHAD